MALLVAMIVITAYAIAITAFHMEQTEKFQNLKRCMNVEKRTAESWRSRAFRMAHKLDIERAGFNDEIHKLEKENKRLLDTNARMMERMKRLTP